MLIPETPKKLSILMTSASQTHRGLLEKTLANLLSTEISLSSTLSYEILLGDTGRDPELKMILKENFPESIQSGRLKILKLDLNAKHKQFNHLSQSATGAYLTFLKPGLCWSADRLKRIETLTPHYDLIIGVNPTSHNPQDPIERLLMPNAFIPGSIVIQHLLFEKLNGFQTPLIDEEWDLCLRGLIFLMKKNLNRYFFESQSKVTQTHFFPLSKLLEDRVHLLQNKFSRLLSFRSLPIRYWKSNLKNLFEST